MNIRIRRKSIAATAILLSAANLFGQNVQHSESDTIKIVNLEEMVVSSMKIDMKMKDTPAQLDVVTAVDCREHSSFTVADVLKYEPGISMGGDGVWATNINVRGMSENRLVTLVDGNRVETATDLTASLSMVDVNDIQRVEVIKGAQSSLYGSGAMGGIVNIISKEGYFSDNRYLHGNVLSGYSGVNNSVGEYLSIGAGDKNWFARVSASYAHADDMKTPEGVLPNSGFTSDNLGLKLGCRPAANQTVKLQFQRNFSHDVGIPGGAAFAAAATADYKLIGRTLVNANYEIENLGDSFKSLKMNIFYQDIVRNVEMIPNSVTSATQPNGMIQITAPELVAPNGRHKTYGGQLQGTWNLNENNLLIAGIDAWQRNIHSERTKYITMTVIKPTGDTIVNNVERGESPLPDASFTSAGVFVQDEMHLLDQRLTITLGGRFDGIFVSNDECHDVDYILKNGETQPLSAQRVTFEAGQTRELSWSANFGARYQLSENTDLVINAARAYRAASLEERFKYIDLTSRVQLGNPNLKPEKGYSADLGIRIHNNRFNAQASVFANRLTDMIVETSGEFIYRLTEDSSIDTLPALVYNNVDRALLYGADFSFSYRINNNLQTYLSGACVVGRDIENDAYLPMIPPMNGRIGIVYSHENAGSVNLSLTAAASKKDGKIADGETATSGYCRIDLSLGSKPFELGKSQLQFFGGIDNLTNTTYTNFLSTNRSSINCEPARNLYIKASLTF